MYRNGRKKNFKKGTHGNLISNFISTIETPRQLAKSIQN